MFCLFERLSDCSSIERLFSLDLQVVSIEGFADWLIDGLSEILTVGCKESIFVGVEEGVLEGLNDGVNDGFFDGLVQEYQVYHVWGSFWLVIKIWLLCQLKFT